MINIRKNVNIHGSSTVFTDRPGNIPALVCIHGNSLSRAEFAPLFEDRKLENYRILTYDLPGHGDSDTPINPEETYTLKGYAAHLAEFIKHLGLERYVLFGVSLGGHIAIEAAATGLDPVPEGIVTVGTPPVGNAKDLAEAFLPGPEDPSLLQTEISREEAKKIVDILTEDVEIKKRCLQEILFTDKNARRCLLKGFKNIPFRDEIDFVLHTDIRLLLAFGERERVVNRKFLEDRGLTANLQGSLRIFSGSAHLPDMTQNSEFLAELAAFLERVES